VHGGRLRDLRHGGAHLEHGLRVDRVYLFDQFTYDDGREMLGYARDLLDHVTAFVDELMTAFEDSTRRAIAVRRAATG
jgi:hypothetical protein